VTAAHAHRSSLRSVAQRDALYEVEGRPQRVKSHAADDRGAGPEGEEAAPERLVDRWACGGVYLKRLRVTTVRMLVGEPRAAAMGSFGFLEGSF
jgi:hypothetical protein